MQVITLDTAIQPFTPTVLGEGVIAQFRTVAYVDTGWYLAAGGWLLILVVLVVGLIGALKHEGRYPAMRRVRVGILFLAAMSVLFALPVRADEMTLIVSADGPYRTIAAALADAQDGDRIEVRGGVYDAPLTIDKSVEMIGIDSPVIDGGGEVSQTFDTFVEAVSSESIIRQGANSDDDSMGD